ncbi:MAG: tRNA lysidine(34) synthetase TilS [Thermodesulfobacteriota bacterium]
MLTISRKRIYKNHKEDLWKNFSGDEGPHTEQLTKRNLIRYSENFILESGLFGPGARILVGVSGGPDSMALLSILAEMRPRWGLDLLVLHCHHGLRKEADEEEALVRSWAKKWNCPFFRRKLPVRAFQKQSGRSLQEAARELRYQAFSQVAKQKKAGLVALAHTADDQAEEFLIGLIRGAGLGGLAGMPVKRGQFIRPLLRVYRSDVYNYLEMEKIPFREDPSNRDFRYLRSRVRYHLLPELKKYSPNILAQLNQTTQLLQKDEEYLQRNTEQIAAELISPSGDSLCIPRHSLAALPQALGSRLIQKALALGLGHLRQVRAVHILSILEGARKSGKQGQIPLPQGWAARWDNTMIQLGPAGQETPPLKPFSYIISKAQEVYIQETGDRISFRRKKYSPKSPLLPKNRQVARVDLKKISWPLLIRNTQPGDRIRPLGLEGSKKVSRFFMDRKLPRALRPRIPLIFSEGEIVWVAGMEIGRAFKVEPQSRWILEIEYHPTLPR